MIKTIGIIIVFLAFLLLEIFALQWLLGLFGYNFSPFTCFCMLIVIDFIFGAIGKGK